MIARRDDLERLAVTAIEAQAAAEWDRWLGMLTDDITYRTIGTTGASGTFNGKAELRSLETFVADVIDGGIGMTVDRAIVEDPVVVVQARGSSVMRASRVRYDNDYCLVLRFRGDLIESWTEYLDTALVDRVLEQESQARRARSV